MEVVSVIKKIKNEFEEAIITSCFNGNSYQNGNKSKEACIRSQKLINYLHNYIKQEFIENGIDSTRIVPPLNFTKPELKITGFLKSKNQDICILPDDNIDINTADINKLLSVNVRSQLSSLAKNIDTLYERTFAEALNLHLSYPSQCLGEVYLIPTHEYDDKAMLENKIKFKNVCNIEQYIKMFQAINDRHEIIGDEYKYERVCLLIADFRKDIPKVYSSTHELIKDGLLSRTSKIKYEGLGVVGFASDLLRVYNGRFHS